MKNLTKKTLALLLALSLCLALAACGAAPSTPSSEEVSAEGSSQEGETPAEKTVIRLAGLKGPTSMGMVKLLSDAEAGETANTYEFSMAGSADEITPKLIQGELDIAAVPSNLASILYNNTEGKVQLLAANTLGVIYIVEKGETVNEIADLKGKTIYAPGKGATPEYALRYILTENGIDPDKDVTIEWKSEPTEVVSVLAASEGGVAMLPQPFVTVAQSSVEGLRIAIDLTKAWDALDNGSQMITGSLVVRKEFAEANPEAVAAFLTEYQASTEYANTNVAETAQLVEKYGIVKAAVAEKAIPYCNITYLAGDELKTAMDGYLKVLFDQNPASVGGKLPDEAFYYAG